MNSFILSDLNKEGVVIKEFKDENDNLPNTCFYPNSNFGRYMLEIFLEKKELKNSNLENEIMEIWGDTPVIIDPEELEEN